MHLTIILFLTLSTSLAVKWDPLRLVVISKRGLLKDEDLGKLQDAMKWFELAIQAARFEKDAEHIAMLKKHVKSYIDNGQVLIMTPNKTISIDFDSPKLNKLLQSSTPIFLSYHAKVCETMLANAKGVVLPNKDHRSAFILMHYCPENSKSNAFHVFRHEILHGLNYGGTWNMTGVKISTYDWVNEDGTKTIATRKVLNTNGVLDFQSIKDHFDCHNRSVLPEADATGGHLNEYIFGNELMTPSLDDTAVFSFISAEILEKIHKGNEPWFKVNRTFIAPEADQYTWGKGLGCDFLFKSCWELFKKSTVKFMYPFCRGSALSGGKMCFKEGTYIDCIDSGLFIARNRTVHESPEGVKMSSKYPSYNVAHFRFCPLAAKDFSKRETIVCG